MKKFWVTAFLALALTGCFSRSPDVQFYVLASPSDQAAVAEKTGPKVALTPVLLPDYLRHAPIVLRQDDQVGIKVEDYHRWGEDLDAGISRVLCASLTNHLADVRGEARPLRVGTPEDMRVGVEVFRFEGVPGGSARLDAAWVVTRNGKTLREGRFQSSVPAGAGMDGLVEAQSRLVEELGAAIAAGVKTVYGN